MITALILLLTCRQQPSNLSAPLSLNFVNAKLSEVVKEISRESGVRVVADGLAGGRTMTVICDRRPCNEILEQMCSCLMLRESQTRQSVKLVTDLDVESEAAQQRSLEDAEFAKSIEDLFSRLQAYAGVPFEDISGELVGELTTAQDPDQPTAVREAAKRKAADLSNPALVMVSCALGLRAAEAAEALVRGEVLILSSLPGGKWPQLDIKMASSTPRNGTLVPPNLVVVKVWLDADRGVLEVSTGFDFGNVANTLMMRGPSDVELPQVSAAGKLLARLKTWVNASDAKLSEVRMETQSELFPVVRFTSGLASLGEHAILLARSAHRPVIADSFRVAVSLPVKMPADNVKDYIDRLRSSSRGADNPEWLAHRKQPGFVRMHDGWIQMRHESFWRLQASAVPEDLVRPLEARYAKGESLRPSDFASFIASLNVVQSRAIADAGFLAQLPREPLSDQSLVRFLASLDDVSGQRMLMGSVEASSLAPQQQALLLDLLADNVLSGCPPVVVRSCLTRNFDGSTVIVGTRQEPVVGGEKAQGRDWWPGSGRRPFRSKFATDYSVQVGVDAAVAYFGCRIDTLDTKKEKPTEDGKTAKN